MTILDLMFDTTIAGDEAAIPFGFGGDTIHPIPGQNVLFVQSGQSIVCRIFAHPPSAVVTFAANPVTGLPTGVMPGALASDQTSFTIQIPHDEPSAVWGTTFKVTFGGQTFQSGDPTIVNENP